MSYVLYMPNEYDVNVPDGVARISFSRSRLVVANKTSLSKNAYKTFDYNGKNLALVPYIGDGDEILSIDSLTDAKILRRELFKRTRSWFKIYEYDGKEMKGCVA